MNIKHIHYHGVECLEVSNKTIKLIISLSIGPRILFYGFKGGNNFFKIFDDQLKNCEADYWQNYGGHRLWHAPEVFPRTYEIDNKPIKYTVDGYSIHLQGLLDTNTKIAKEIMITVPTEGSGVRLTHLIRNHNVWSVELAAWSLSVMAAGGRAIVPQETFIPHSEYLLPARPIVLWHFTPMNDPRLSWGEKYIQVREDIKANTPLKIGVLNKQQWMAYILSDGFFIKQHDYQNGVTYPDYNSNAEIYTESGFLEIETLSPLTRLDPGQALTHHERWALFADQVGEDDIEIENKILPKLAELVR